MGAEGSWLEGAEEAGSEVTLEKNMGRNYLNGKSALGRTVPVGMCRSGRVRSDIGKKYGKKWFRWIK